jgi:hypothetical protein
MESAQAAGRGVKGRWARRQGRRARVKGRRARRQRNEKLGRSGHAPASPLCAGFCKEHEPHSGRSTRARLNMLPGYPSRCPPELWRPLVSFGQNYNGEPIAGLDTRPGLAETSTGVDFCACLPCGGN